MNWFSEIEEPPRSWAICQECHRVELVNIGDQLPACTDKEAHEAPAPFLTVPALFRTIAQCNTVLKAQPGDPGVTEHKKLLLAYMRELNEKVLYTEEHEPGGNDGARGPGECRTDPIT